MDRRRALLVLASAPLAACQATGSPVVIPVPPQLPEWVRDLKLVADGLAGALPALGSLGLSADLVARAQGWIVQLERIADAAVAAVPADGKATVSTFVQVAAQVVSALGEANLPASVRTILAAASALLPVIQVAVGLFLARRGAAPQMPADRARAVLAAARRR